MKSVTKFSDIRLELPSVPAKDPFKHPKVPRIGLQHRVLLEFPWQFLFFANDAKLIMQRFNWHTRGAQNTQWPNAA